MGQLRDGVEKAQDNPKKGGKKGLLVGVLHEKETGKGYGGLGDHRGRPVRINEVSLAGKGLREGKEVSGASSSGKGGGRRSLRRKVVSE